MLDVVATVIAMGVSWGVLMLSMHMLARFVNITIPENPEWALKVAALVGIGAGLELIPWAGWVISVATYWYLMRKWFDADLWAIVYVTLIGNLLTTGAAAAITAGAKAL